jgi:hypothetical protein
MPGATDEKLTTLRAHSTGSAYAYEYAHTGKDVVHRKDTGSDRCSLLGR